MRKFLNVILWLLLFSGKLFSQSYGLQFSSHEEVPERRTSLNLTTNEPLCLNEDTKISFNFKLVPNLKTYFGYVVRIITTNGQNIDIVCKEKIKGLDFVIGESYSINFMIDSARLFGEWNHFLIEFDIKQQEVLFYVNKKFIGKSKLNFDNKTCCKVFFGANNQEQFMTIDVPPMLLKDISITEGKNQKHFYPLSEISGNQAMDIIGKKTALINNPLWIKPRHLNWKQIQAFVTSGTPSVAFDKKTETLYIVSNDSLQQLSLKTNQLTGSKLAKSIVDLPAGNQSIFDASSNKLYNLYIDDKIVSVYNPAENSWQTGTVKKKLTEFWQANKFISSFDSALYILGGYGQLHYKNLVQRYDFSNQKWEISNPQGDFFIPRYLAALGTNAAADTAYIIGGYGSKTGDQAINPRHNYELMAYSVRSQTFKHIYNLKQPEKEFCFSNSLIIDAATNQFYGLIYPIDRFNSSLQLIRGSLNSPEYELMGDSIPYLFHDIESFSDLFYCPSSQKLVAVTLLNSQKKATSIKIFTLDFPPNPQVVAQPTTFGSKKGYWFFASLIMIILLGAIIYGLKKWRKQKLQPVLKPTEPGIQIKPAFESLAVEETLSAHGLYEKATAASCIFLFGHFEVIDKEGNEITRQFTPLLKEMFLLILLYTYKDGKGISSDQLFETLWTDKTVKDARNNFSVNIVKLKSILEKTGSTAITKESGKWRFEILNNSIQLDYHQFMMMASEKPASIDKNYINQLLEIIYKGAFLREVHYPWLDDSKAKVSDFIINTIFSYTSKVSLQAEPDLILKLTNCVFQFDQMNEEALVLKCRSLIILGRHAVAKDTYLNFTKEFKKNYGHDFERPYTEITGHL